MGTIIIIAVISLLIAVTLFSMIVFTPENHYSFITVFGKYQKTVAGGLTFKMPFVSSVDKRAYLGLQSQKIALNLKTKDQVTFNLDLNVQYRISDNVDEAFKAMYQIGNFIEEMKSNTTDVAIPVANKIDIEEVYNQKDNILDAVKERLEEFFADYGITIVKVLSDEPQLPRELEEQANAVMVAKRSKEAAIHEAETIKTKKVGEATADGDSVKIRMNKQGEAREEYAEKTALGVQKLVAQGCSPNAALEFLNQIGEQDAIVSAARNGAATIFHTTKQSTGTSADVLLANQMQGSKKSED